MASQRLCTTCLRAMRQQWRVGAQASRRTQHPPTIESQTRLLSTSPPYQHASSSPQPSPSPPKSSPPTSTLATTLAQTLRTRASSTTETYIAYGATQSLFTACSSQADYTIPQATQSGVPAPKTPAGEDLGVGNNSWWYTDLGLTPTFSTWSQVTFLHMYILTVRLRALPSSSSFQTYSQHLLDHFSHNAEHRMVTLHGMSARGVRNQYLKDLFLQWRGVMAAYDEGLVKGDAVLAAAVWRNLWKASEQGVDWVKVGMVVSYMRRVVAMLEDVKDGAVMAAVTGLKGLQGQRGFSVFGATEREREVVGGRRSKGLSEPFVEGEGKATALQ